MLILLLAGCHRPKPIAPPPPEPIVKVDYEHRGCEGQLFEFNEAEQKFEEEKFDEAIAGFSQVISWNPGCIAAELGLADSYRSKSQCAEAETHYARADSLGVVSANAHYFRGRCLRRLKRLHAAISELRTAVRFSPRSPYPHSTIAWIFAKQKRFDEAIVEAWKALNIDAEFVDALHVIGYGFEESGNHDDAIAAYSEAIRLEKNNADIFHNRGVALMRKGQLESAIEDFSEAIKLAPSADTFVLRGLSRCRLGQRGIALSDYNEALRLPSSDEDARRIRNTIKQCRTGSNDPATPAPH